MNEMKIKGLTTELQCQTFFTSLGYNVSIPLGEDCRYDMIIDIDNILLRIQVKHPSVTETGITISTKSTQSNNNENKTLYYNKEQIDYFATYYNNQCYLIKVEECSSSKTLAFNKIHPSQNYIKDYEAEKEIQRILNSENEIPNEKIINIYQYDLRNNLINTYENAVEAAKALGDASKNAHITAVLNGKRKTAYGYKWSRTLLKS